MNSLHRKLYIKQGIRLEIGYIFVMLLSSIRKLFQTIFDLKNFGKYSKKNLQNIEITCTYHTFYYLINHTINNRKLDKHRII